MQTNKQTYTAVQKFRFGGILGLALGDSNEIYRFKEKNILQ